ncbi:MAG: VCBS repeat-containing protein [Planctomycetes bacterium]|nr:VCBS repeat-containing protein [Planctomycetota bacterium]
MDINNDGYSDLLSGSWPGEIFLFKGGPDNSFAAPEMIKDKDGKIINIGGGIRERGFEGGMSIAGNAKFERTPEGTFVNYRGKRYESTLDRPIGITGTASTARVADWDGDGDYDLIIGDINGKVYFVPNEGTKESYAFGKERQLTSVRSRRAGPFTADWDSDGDLDLLVGAEDGSVSLYRNTGDVKSPELAPAVQLVPPGQKTDKTTTQNAPREVCRGRRSKICVTDWNDDGLLDLLVGDIVYQKPDLPEPTPHEKTEHEQARKELQTVQKKYGELMSKIHGPSRLRKQEEIDQVERDMQPVRKRMTELRSKLPREYDRHGWVWLFLRKKI